MIAAAFLLPLCAGALAWRRGGRGAAWTAGAALAALAAAVWTARAVLAGQTAPAGPRDALSALFLSLIALTACAAALCDMARARRAGPDAGAAGRGSGRDCLVSACLVTALFGTVIAEHPLLVWGFLALAAVLFGWLTALAGAAARRAAARYLRFAALGLGLALLGILLLYLAGPKAGVAPPALEWTNWPQLPDKIGRRWSEAGYLLTLTGLGVLAGLAPLHFWQYGVQRSASLNALILLPALTHTALYVLVRVYAIADAALRGQAGGYLFFFALLSLLASLPPLARRDRRAFLVGCAVGQTGLTLLAASAGALLGWYGALLCLMSGWLARIAWTVALAGRLPASGRMPPLMLLAGAGPTAFFSGALVVILAGAAANKPLVALAAALWLAALGAALLRLVVPPAGAPPLRVRLPGAAAVAALGLLAALGGAWMPAAIGDALYQAALTVAGSGR